MYNLKYPHLTENENNFAKYVQVRVCGYLQDNYGKLFKNGHWPPLTEITVTEGNTAHEQRTDNNGDPICANSHKCYKCGGNNIPPDCP